MIRSFLLSVTLLAGGAAHAQQDGFYTTRDDLMAPPPPVQAPVENLPWVQNSPQQQITPPGYVPPVAAPAAPAMPTDMPFRRGSSQPNSYQPAVIPGGAAQQAVPVEQFDAIEVTEPPAPTNPVLVADPAKEDPTEPTEMNAPLFSAEADRSTPRTIKLSVLNKVTARAEAIEAKPGEQVEFGKLVIKAVQCYQSLPSSQPDSVALLSISERVPDSEEPKLLFHGWMYASSPSITALEHPVYDVTMRGCELKKPEAADAVKDDKKKDAKASEKKKN